MVGKRGDTRASAAAMPRAGRRGHVKSRSGLAGRGERARARSRRAPIPPSLEKSVKKAQWGPRTRALFGAETGTRAAHLRGHIRHIRAVCRRGWRSPPRRPVVAHGALQSRGSLWTRVALPGSRSADIFTLFYKTFSINAHWRREFSRVDIFQFRSTRICWLPTRTSTAQRGHLAALRGRRAGPRVFRAHRSVRSALAALPAARPRRCRCHDVRFGASSRPLAGRSPSPRARSSTPRRPGGRG